MRGELAASVALSHSSSYSAILPFTRFFTCPFVLLSVTQVLICSCSHSLTHASIHLFIPSVTRASMGDLMSHSLSYCPQAL